MGSQTSLDWRISYSKPRPELKHFSSPFQSTPSLSLAIPNPQTGCVNVITGFAPDVGPSQAQQANERRVALVTLV